MGNEQLERSRRARNRREAEELAALAEAASARSAEEEFHGVEDSDAVSPDEIWDEIEGHEWQEQAGHLSADLIRRRRAIVAQLVQAMERNGAGMKGIRMLSLSMRSLDNELLQGRLQRVRRSDGAMMGMRAQQTRALTAAIAGMRRSVMAGVPGAADDLACLVDLYRDLGGSVSILDLDGMFDAAAAPSIV